MSSLNLHISLPSELQMFVSRRVKARGYQSFSEYVRDLLRKDELEAAKDKLRGLLMQGLQSESVDSWGDVKAGLDQKIRQAKIKKPSTKKSKT